MWNLLHGLHSLHASDPGLNRVLAQGIHGPEGRKINKEDEDEQYVEVVTKILTGRPDVYVDRPVMAALVIVHTIEQLVRWLGHEAQPDVDADAFLEEPLSMLLRYLSGGQGEEQRSI